MGNLPIVAEEKRLNIFQKIRLELFKRKIYKISFNIEEYINAPEYIKRDDNVIDKVIEQIKYNMYYSEQTTEMEQLEMKEKKLLIIPEDKLIERIKLGTLSGSDFLIDNKIRLAKKVPEMFMGPQEKIDTLIKAIEIGEYDFISIYPKKQSEIINKLKEDEILDKELPNIINYLENPNPFIKKNPDLIKNLDIEKQKKLANDNKDYLKYMNEDIQLQHIIAHGEDAVYASDIVAEEYIKIDKRNLAKTNLEFQLKIVQQYPNACKYISEEAEKEIWSNPLNEEAAKTAIELLKKDIRYSKKIAEYGFEAVYEKFGVKNGYYFNLQEYFKSATPETVKEFFLYSKLLSSKGTILMPDISMHGSTVETIIQGRDGYNKYQKQIIQNLSLDQIQELLNVDSNYIVPYLMIDDNLPNREKDLSKQKCIEIFGKMYGTQKLNELMECINIIYEKNSEIKTDNIEAFGYDSGTLKKRINFDHIFINEFKILFNKEIISNSNVEDIKEYFEKVKKEEPNQKEFYKLMQNAYGNDAVDILKSRPKLNVHTINSLEVFDKRIYDTFGEAFVHDLISYNIRDYQEFLAVIKDDIKLETFKTYYEVLTKIMGNNVETMQRAISEYNYFDELLQNVRDVELTDKQYGNLVTVLCSKDNQFDINSLQELQNYDEILNEIIKKRINKEKNKALIGQDEREIKRIICADILGLRSDKNEVRDYGDSLEDITNFYEISLEKDEHKEMYSETEMQMLECLNFISNEEDKVKLIQLAEKLLEEKDIKNPVVMHNAVAKLKENQTELLNSTLLTVEKMDELCEQEDKDNPRITKEITEDGLTKYILRGIDFKIMIHSSQGLPFQDFIDSEMQLGNQYICSRMVTNNNIITGRDFGKYCYSKIKSIGGVAAYYKNDANTDHRVKTVRGSGGEKSKITEEIDSNPANEIAQYRRYRDHKDISNKNIGGKFLPDFVRNPSEEDIEFMKKHNIPILEIDVEAYRKIAEQKKEQQKNKEQKEER